MEQYIPKIATLLIGLGLLAFNYLLDLLAGVLKHKKVLNEKFSWKKLFLDLAKAITFALLTIMLATDYELLKWFTSRCGLDISEFGDILSTSAIAVILIWKSVSYMLNATNNYKDFLNYKDDVKDLIEKANIDYKGITDDVMRLVEEVCGCFVKQDSDDTPEMGANCYYIVPHATPDEFFNNVNGKGFNEGYGMQCVAGFKEFQYCVAGYVTAAGGGAQNYASEPYRSRVCAMGFTWHDGISGMKNGDWAIWRAGTYGHVSMYYNGKFFGQNQGAADSGKGNPFNLMSLGTRDIVGYFRPNIYDGQNPTPTPTPTPEPQRDVIEYTYQKGDSFGNVLIKLGLDEGHLWGADGTVAYYSEQLHEQGLWGNIPIGTTIRLKPRK